MLGLQAKSQLSRDPNSCIWCPMRFFAPPQSQTSALPCPALPMPPACQTENGKWNASSEWEGGQEKNSLLCQKLMSSGHESQQFEHEWRQSYAFSWARLGFDLIVNFSKSLNLLRLRMPLFQVSNASWQRWAGSAARFWAKNLLFFRNLVVNRLAWLLKVVLLNLDINAPSGMS